MYRTSASVRRPRHCLPSPCRWRWSALGWAFDDENPSLVSAVFPHQDARTPRLCVWKYVSSEGCSLQRKVGYPSQDKGYEMPRVLVGIRHKHDNVLTETHIAKAQSHRKSFGTKLISHGATRLEVGQNTFSFVFSSNKKAAAEGAHRNSKDVVVVLVNSKNIADWTIPSRPTAVCLNTLLDERKATSSIAPEKGTPGNVATALRLGGERRGKARPLLLFRQK